MSVVLDASVTLSWLFDDEASAEAEMIINRVLSEGALVPVIWLLEVANGLSMALRRKRIDVSFREESIEDLRILPVTTDPETIDRIWSETLALADRHGLTVYDATYLELALRSRLPLASLDYALVAAARRSGVATLGA